MVERPGKHNRRSRTIMFFHLDYLKVTLLIINVYIRSASALTSNNSSQINYNLSVSSFSSSPPPLLSPNLLNEFIEPIKINITDEGHFSLINSSFSFKYDSNGRINSTESYQPITILPSESSTLNPFGIDAELKCDSNNQCPTNSHCVNSFCQCIPGYCRNSGKCIISSSEVFCLCTLNFSGPKCEFTNQPCGDNHCLNGATCVNNTNCFCSPGILIGIVSNKILF